MGQLASMVRYIFWTINKKELYKEVELLIDRFLL